MIEKKMQANTSWAYQFGLLAKRNFLNLIRLPQTSYVKLLTTCMTALFAILLFFDTTKDVQGIQNGSSNASKNSCNPYESDSDDSHNFWPLFKTFVVLLINLIATF